MTCLATLRHNAGEAAIAGAEDERVWAQEGAHGSAVRLERCRDRLRHKLRLCGSSIVAGFHRLWPRRRDANPGPFAPEFTRGSFRGVSSPLVGEDQGGGSRHPSQQWSSDACDNGSGDPPPIGRSEERPSIGRAMPAPTRGGGCANAIGSVEKPQVLSPEAPVSFGGLANASPLLAVFVVGKTAPNRALGASELAEPKLELVSAGCAWTSAGPSGYPAAGRLRPNRRARAIASAKRAQSIAGTACHA